MINIKKVRRSNLYFPKTFSCYTYNRFIKQFIDQYNWGHLTKDGIKKFRITTKYLNICWAKQCYPFDDIMKLKLHSHIIPHLNESETYFYTSNPFSNVGMFVIDLDDTENSTPQDMKNAAEYITSNFHQGAYYETSTSGKGIHIYFFIDVSVYNFTYDDIDTVNDYLNKDDKDDNFVAYSTLLSQIVQLEGFNCKVDRIKGTFPRYVFSNKTQSLQIVKRGNLCKLPRPKNEEDFFKLAYSPIQTLPKIQENSDSIQKQLKGRFGLNSTKPLSTISIPNLPPNIPPPITNNILHMNNPKKGKKGDVEKLRSRDAIKRTVGSIQYLARYLKRMPNYDEWHKFYVDNGLNTGAETPRRKERFNSCYEFVEKTFDAEKCGPLYKVGDFLDDILQRITTAELQELCSKTKTKITHADLDVAMGYHWVCTVSNRRKGWEFTVPTKGMISWFRSIKELGLHNRSCDRTKLILLRQALQRIGYIICIDDYYIKGVSKKWSIGENCPKYQDFVTFGFQYEVPQILQQAMERRECIVDNAESNNC